jgi:ABC-type multidrug transport system fused ATPase/permease subunit
VRTFLRILIASRIPWYLWVLPTLTIAAVVPLVVYLPLVQKELIDEVLLAQRLDLLPLVVGRFALVWLLIAVLQALGNLLRTYLDEQISLHVRGHLFAHCERLSVPLWHEGHGGQTMAIFSNDVPQVVGFVGSGFVMAIGQLLTLVAGGLVILHLSWQLAVVVVVVPAFVAGVATLITRPLRSVSRRAQDKAADSNQRLHESLAGLREIAAFGQEQAQEARFLLTLKELLRLRMHLAGVGTAISAGQSLFALTVALVILGVGGYLVITGQTTLGTVLAVQELFGQVYPTTIALAALVVSGQRVLASADRIREFLDVRPRLEERTNALELHECSGEIVFEDVTFGYVQDRPVLRDVSFSVRPGDVVALVGPSGAGKTTLVGLIARFYDPQRGRVLLDGVDLRDLATESIRRNIGIVFQDPFLFAASIRENIAFGREGASEPEIVAAARAANAWEFIERLPAGLATHVGQRGVQLSEGQKQRLAIARALLRDPTILILDEPTSALDARSEHLLQEALKNLMRGRTSFVIAHRLATVRRADRILVLDEGRVIEQGTHEELLARQGLYQELYALQRDGTRVATDGNSEPGELALVASETKTTQRRG